jgi:hypothetical protein
MPNPPKAQTPSLAELHAQLRDAAVGTATNLATAEAQYASAKRLRDAETDPVAYARLSADLDALRAPLAAAREKDAKTQEELRSATRELDLQTEHAELAVQRDDLVEQWRAATVAVPIAEAALQAVTARRAELVRELAEIDGGPGNVGKLRTAQGDKTTAESRLDARASLLGNFIARNAAVFGPGLRGPHLHDTPATWKFGDLELERLTFETITTTKPHTVGEDVATNEHRPDLGSILLAHARAEFASAEERPS